MKKMLVVALLLLLPSVALAASFSKDSFIATDSAATSTFAGNFSISGRAQFNLGNGLLSIVNGLLTTATVQSPLTFGSNALGCQFATSTQGGCLTAADWVRFDAATQGGGAAPGGNNREIQINENGVFGANNRFVFDPTTGFLGVGTSSQYRPMNRWEFMSETADTVGTSLVHTNYNSGASPVAAFTARGSRGTQANPLPVLNNDTLGTISFSGFDGASFPLAAPAFIRGFAGENWSSEARGAGIQFFTTPVGSTARTERLRLDGNGQLIFPVAGGTILGANASGQDSQGGSIRIVAGAGSGGPLEGSDGNVIIAAAASNWGIGLIGAPNNGFVPDGPNSFVLYSPPSNIIALANYDGHEALLNMSLLTSHKTFTFPNATGTLALLQSEQTWTGVNTFSKGSAATTTVNFGETGNTTSRVCFNTKDVDGNDVSFYIANDTLKVEHNICR